MYAVIMAGGRGTRFWPRSRAKKPKHLLDITGGRTMIQETVDRIRPLIAPEKILVVTGRTHAWTLFNQLPEIPHENIIIEPQGKNTAPCIGLAALHVRKRATDEIMVVLAADHAIADPRKFQQALKAALQAAEAPEALVTIGIKPTSPQTGFGYIEQGEAADVGRRGDVFRVKSIREKPDLRQAQLFLHNGNFFWNSGMFVWRASTILKAIARWLPDLSAGLEEIDAALGLSGEAAVMRRVYKKFAPISIDYGVMEKADNVFVVKGDFGWSDVGSWDALWEITAKDANGNTFIGGGRVIAKDTNASLVYSRRKLVALAGIKGLIVVETDDALLICPRGRSQDVKNLVEALEAEKLKKYL